MNSVCVFVCVSVYIYKKQEKRQIKSKDLVYNMATMADSFIM